MKLNIINVQLPECKENYTKIRLNNDKEVNLNHEGKFLTYFNADHWVVVDTRGRRDSKKAQYKDFCLDRYITPQGHKGTVAITCEQNEENYCKEKSCFHVCCPLFQYFDEEYRECVWIRSDGWLDELEDKRPSFSHITIKNTTQIYENLGSESLQCESEDDYLLPQKLTEHDIKFLSNGELDIDGALIPIRQHCYNQKGNTSINFKRINSV